MIAHVFPSTVEPPHLIPQVKRVASPGMVETGHSIRIPFTDDKLPLPPRDRIEGLARKGDVG